jgi:hypothetical protein
MVLMALAKAARLTFVSDRDFNPRETFFEVAFPKAPSVPRRFMEARARCKKNSFFAMANSLPHAL